MFSTIGIETVFYFLLAISILVSAHEFGHFIIAKLCGVKVLRFSLGFGKTLWQYQKNADCTEYRLSLLPLGGYVKMLDEREGNVSAEELPLTFNRQSLVKRAAILLGGPFFNLILAFLLFSGFLLPIGLINTVYTFITSLLSFPC